LLWLSLRWRKQDGFFLQGSKNPDVATAEGLPGQVER
jgi:hypothetical protein